MKEIDADQTAIWQSGQYDGDNAPMQRATIQRANLVRQPYDMTDRNELWNHRGRYRSFLFEQTDVPVELPNIKSINWNRDVNSDVATCTIVLYNTRQMALGETPENNDELDRPGFYSPTRGASATLNARWNHTQQWPWVNLLIPDRLIRTYEGYGFDPDVPPTSDPAMSPSGVWRVDTVVFGNDGLITLSCRDIGSLLMDHIMHPPVVPVGIYPLWWEQFGTRGQYSYERGINVDAYRRPTYDDDSNQAYVGEGVEDNGIPIVGAGGVVEGHHGSDAFDNNNEETSWRSTGFVRSGAGSFPWLQGRLPGVHVEAVRVSVHGGPYKMYVSIFADGEWKGSNRIPYTPGAPDDSIDIGADIKFVGSFLMHYNANRDFVLPTRYENVTKVRLTFTNLWHSNSGVDWPYRAVVQDFETAGQVTSVEDPVTINIGRYNDYTDIIKWLVSWGGFHWPNNATIIETDGSTISHDWVNDDEVLARGRAWGDFEQTGTAGQTTLGPELFDKRPLMDGIAYVREIIGYNFLIDEEGGVVWRSPNIWEVGNYISSVGSETLSDRTEDIIEIDEQDTLMEIQVTLSSENQRDRVFVANSNGKFGAVAYGFNPNPAIFRRVSGWTDQHFRNADECQVMADLIAVRQMFDYRTVQVTIPGNPAIQVDDQVRLIERITAEYFLHYVRGISSTFDMESRKWTYALQTHWLGTTPFSMWAFDPEKLARSTRLYLQAIGKMA